MQTPSFTPLVGDRVVVRRFRDDDATTFASYRSDPEVARFQDWDAPFDLADAVAFVRSLADEEPGTPGQWFQYAVEDRTTGEHVGDVACHTDRDEPRRVTVGVTFAGHAQGRGLATEALSLLLDDLVDRQGVHRIAADCDTRNHAVVSLLARLGFRREAHHVASWPEPDGTWSDEYVYAMLADEWRQSRGSRP